MQLLERDLVPLIDILKANASDCQLILLPLGLEKIFLEELRLEQISPLWSFEQFYLIPRIQAKNKKFFWIQWSGWELELITFNSINHAITQLKKKSATWSTHSFTMHRRNALIQEGLKSFNLNKRLKFPEAKKYFFPKKELPFWTLLDKNLALIANKTSSSVKLGIMEFDENKIDPPSRAYLKLWDVLVQVPKFPVDGELVLDLGSSPGGWTWVLANLGLKVISIDKAPLDPKVISLKNVNYVRESIFAIDPKNYLHAKWVFCDVICYPEKIYSVILNWLEAGYQGNMIFTIKFQGETDFAVIKKLSHIANSQLIHLYHNKHELTWIRMQNPS